jgi:hypothetical protein
MFGQHVEELFAWLPSSETVVEADDRTALQRAGTNESSPYPPPIERTVELLVVFRCTYQQRVHALAGEGRRSSHRRFLNHELRVERPDPMGGGGMTGFKLTETFRQRELRMAARVHRLTGEYFWRGPCQNWVHGTDAARDEGQSRLQRVVPPGTLSDEHGVGGVRGTGCGGHVEEIIDELRGS